MENIRNFIKTKTVVVFLIALVIMMIIVKPASFLSANNTINILVQISSYGMVAYAMTFAIICGEFDLSVSSTFAMSTILYIDISSKMNVPMGMLCALLFGLGIGAINGYLVSKHKMSAFIVTLATMVAVKGLALFYTDTPISINSDAIYEIGNGTFLGIPYIVYVFFAVLVIAQIILTKTQFGRNLYATGGNESVAKVAGIHVGFYKFIIFVILGGMSAFGAIFFASRLNAGSALYANDLALYCVAATVIGGTRLTGGSGSALRTFLGLLVMGILFNGLTLLKIDASYQNIIKGAVVIAVVAMDSLTKKQK
jgi:ribose transport system permease protein